MRIVLVNWAKIWDGASHGGGVNGYAQALALEYIARGHEVVSLCSGQTYLPESFPEPRDSAEPDAADAANTAIEPGPCRVVRHADWLGVRVFEVVNSPVLSPSQPQFGDPLGELSAPELEARVAELLADVRPDLVHFHNLEGFSAGCVHAARAAKNDLGVRAAVAFSLHNYHTICPQVYLLHRHRHACYDFQGGAQCANCVDAIDPAAEQRRLASAYLKTVPAPPAPEPPKPRPYRFGMETWRALGRDLRTLFRPIKGPEPPPPARPPVPVPLPGVQADPRGEGVRIALPILGADQGGQDHDTRGQTEQLRTEANPPEEPGPGHPDWTPIENDPSTPPVTGPVNDYGRRRVGMVEALNACDRVLAVSEFVRAKFESMGVDGSRLMNLPIGTRFNRLAEWHKAMLFDPPPIDRLESGELSRPVRMVFMGYNNWAKGLPMMGDALERMPARLLRRLHLSVYAKDGENIEWKFRRMEPRLGGLTFKYGYRPHDVPWICGGQDLGVVPSVWWDNGPQTVIEFRACGLPVLGARLGGIPDTVRDGVDGVLFRGNDRDDFVAKLSALLERLERLFELREQVRKPKDIEVHAEEMLDLYRVLMGEVGSAGSPGPAGDPASPEVVTRGPGAGSAKA
ncbi:MAG: glycosyltransferase [Planctomycetota bacterium]